MSAAEALRAAHAAGVTVMFDGEGLVLEANAEPPQAVLDALWRHKLAVLALIRPSQSGWSAEHWRGYFDKRSRIAESNDGLPRAEAEALASACCVIEWLNQHPAPSTPGRCARCGRPESLRAVVPACMASRRMLASLASGAEGGRHCGAARNRHSSMRAQ